MLAVCVCVYVWGGVWVQDYLPRITREVWLQWGWLGEEKIGNRAPIKSLLPRYMK